MEHDALGLDGAILVTFIAHQHNRNVFHNASQVTVPVGNLPNIVWVSTLLSINRIRKQMHEELVSACNIRRPRTFLYEIRDVTSNIMMAHFAQKNIEISSLLL